MSLSLGVNLLLPRELYLEWQVVVQIWECDPVFAADGLPDDDLVDVVKLVPILVSATKTGAYITIRLEPRSEKETAKFRLLFWAEATKALTRHYNNLALDLRRNFKACILFPRTDITLGGMNFLAHFKMSFDQDSCCSFIVVLTGALCP